MEALSESLQPHKELVGQVASIVTIAQFFSGAFICRDIQKKGNTQGISSLAFVGGSTVGILMLVYARILNDPAMLKVNIAAIFLNVIYLLCYIYYSEDLQKEVLTPVSYGVAIIATMVGYSYYESPENLEFRYGLIVTILMLLLIGSPLMDLKEIIDKKDASTIPFPMTLMGAIVSFLWLVYGIILLNYFMIVQNIIGLILCTAQLTLIFQYPGKPTKKSKKQKKTTKRD